jgi:hypothetical protein
VWQIEVEEYESKTALLARALVSGRLHEQSLSYFHHIATTLFEAEQVVQVYIYVNAHDSLGRIKISLYCFRSGTGHARGRGLMSILPESEADKQRKKIIEHHVSLSFTFSCRRFYK